MRRSLGRHSTDSGLACYDDRWRSPVRPRPHTGDLFLPLITKIVHPYIVFAYPTSFAPEKDRRIERVAAWTGFTFRVTAVVICDHDIHGQVHGFLRVAPSLLFDCHALSPGVFMQLSEITIKYESRLRVGPRCHQILKLEGGGKR